MTLAKAAVAVFLVGCAQQQQPASARSPAITPRSAAGDSIANLSANSVSLCDATAPVHCFALARTNTQGDVFQSDTPAGLTPSDLASAYSIPSGEGVTVAIVDANDDPNAEDDLNVYRQQFGLGACTTANGCFTKVNENGQASPLPAADSGWAGEISLDLDMVSAACPNCKILLIEANPTAMSDLGTAVNTAVSMGAKVVTNSYGGSEDKSQSDVDPSYHHDGVSILVSSGDAGYAAEYPATSTYVTAVGGTTLTKDSSTRGWSEKTWSDGGSGCSQFETKPSWQNDPSCSFRTVADVSVVADPNTGVAMYDTYGSEGAGWMVIGGTSVSSPLLAGIYAVTGVAGVDGSFAYSHSGAFNDVSSGTNGIAVGTPYLCEAVAGYDGPTGWGSPNGTAIQAQTETKQPAPPAAGGTCAGNGGVGNGGGDCAHSPCTIGVALDPNCDPCVKAICAVSPDCCTTTWGANCMIGAVVACAGTCTPGGQ